MSSSHPTCTFAGRTLAIAALGHLFASAAHGQSAPAVGEATPAAIVDALKVVAGNPPAMRATFARGQCVRGSYTPSAQAAEITKSPSFTKASSVTGRFSVGGGNPKVADTNKAVLKGFSFRLGEPGNVSELLMENAPVHFAENLNQMLAFLQARAPGPDGKPDAARVKAFSDANPDTLNQARFVAARPLPGSFAGVSYWGVHSFPATNVRNETRFIKFKLVPLAGEIVLSDEEAKTKPAEFLVADLEKRISDGGVRFDVMALLGRVGDPTMNVTARWPDEDNRESVRLGTITITGLDSNASCDQTIFNPANLASGIGHPKDEIFKARLTAYAISLAKRR